MNQPADSVQDQHRPNGASSPRAVTPASHGAASPPAATSASHASAADTTPPHPSTVHTSAPNTTAPHLSAPPTRAPADSDHHGHNHGTFRSRGGEGGLNLKPSGRTSMSTSGTLEERSTHHPAGQTVGNIAVENPVFSCRDVNVYYGHKHALKKVSIDVGRKQV